VQPVACDDALSQYLGSDAVLDAINYW